MISNAHFLAMVRMHSCACPLVVGSLGPLCSQGAGCDREVTVFIENNASTIEI